MDGCSRCTGEYGEDGGDLRMKPQGWSSKRGDGVRRLRSEERLLARAEQVRVAGIIGELTLRVEKFTKRRCKCGEIRYTYVPQKQ